VAVTHVLVAQLGAGGASGPLCFWFSDSAAIARRKALAYTQEALAQALGVELSTVGRWERGTLTPQPWRRPELAKALKVSLEQLDRLVNPPGPQSEFATGLVSGFDSVPSSLDAAPVRPSHSTARLLVGAVDNLDELLVHLQDQWHTLVRADNLLGPRFAPAGVRDQISIIEELLPSCTALAGEEMLSHRALDAAHQWAALDNAGDARGGHGSFCTQTYVESQRAHCWTALGKPHRAVQVYELVLPTLPPVYRRDRGTACSRFAQAQVNAGQFEAGANMASEALAIARGSGSVRTE
jgi:transcriptional regulator with XRE-family HTH domain